eukprot:jgi/Mesen1/10660/ME000009S10452
MLTALGSSGHGILTNILSGSAARCTLQSSDNIPMMPFFPFRGVFKPHEGCVRCTSAKGSNARLWNATRKYRAPRASQADPAVSTVESSTGPSYKHILVPVMDSNPYLSEATRQALAMAAQIAKVHGSKITVIVIDASEREQIKEHDVKMSNIRWHLGEGGFQEFNLMEKLGEGKKPAAVIGEVADDMGQDLVVFSMEAIHTKHVDANLLVEFVPCPVLLLPL